ncbi:hypothetical protein SARC_08694, partial [Sphaeroforma arctica JP610]
ADKHQESERAGARRVDLTEVLPAVTAEDCPVQGPFGVVDNTHIGNIVDARLVDVNDAHDPTLTKQLLCTAGVDKTVALFEIQTMEPDHIAYSRTDTLDHHKGCVVSVRTHPQMATHPYVLLCSMDKTASLYNTHTGEVVQVFPQHTKFVTVGLFSPGVGAYVVLGGSYDQTVSVHRWDVERDMYAHVHTLSFKGPVESMCFSPDGSELCVGVRNDHCMHFIDFSPTGTDKGVPNFGQLALNMNSLRDDWVSFTPMDVSYSPNGKLLLVSTDKNRLNLYQRDQMALITSFYGSSNDEYSQPRHSWDPSSRFIYQTSQDYKIYGWNVQTQQIVVTLEGHTKQVRNLSGYTSADGCFILVSCAYDSTIRLWK